MYKYNNFILEIALDTANILVFENTGKYLRDLEIQVLIGAWKGHTYEQIAETLGKEPSYIGRDIGRELWKKLSEALGEKVSKNNFKEALRRKSRKWYKNAG